jgi:4-carboxymuconolactone decarboxylase
MTSSLSAVPPTPASDATPDLGLVYRQILGHVPPNIASRWDVEKRVGRHATGIAIEALRRECIGENNPLGLRWQQTVQFAQLVVLNREVEAGRHAVAALRAGATLEELAGVAESSLIVAGMAAYSLGLRIVGQLASYLDTHGEAAGEPSLAWLQPSAAS